MAEDKVKKEIEYLMNSTLPFGKKMLQDFTEFYPYAGILTKNNKIVDIGASDGSSFPNSTDLLDIINNELIRKIQIYSPKAISVVSNVYITIPKDQKKMDAIQVFLEHKNDFAVNVFYPYIISEGDLKNIQYQTSFASKTEKRFFIGS